MPWSLALLLVVVSVLSLGYGCRASAAKSAAEAKADTLLRDSLPAWRLRLAKAKLSADSAGASADMERAKRLATEASRARIKREADSTDRVADSLLAAARTADDSLAAIPGLVADRRKQHERADSAESALASAESEAKALRVKADILAGAFAEVQRQRDVLAGALDTLRRAGRCTLTHPCFAVTVGTGFGVSPAGKFTYNVAQVTGGVRFDLPGFLRRGT